MSDTNKTFPIRHEELFDTAAAETYMRDQGLTLGDAVEWTQFKGGSSNITYQCSDGQRTYILRRPPLGPVVKTGHDMTREVSLLARTARTRL